METKKFNDLYKQVSSMRITDFPPSVLSGLLHGYLSVYFMVRVHPWLEGAYDNQWKIYNRIREIAEILASLVKDHSLPVEERVGYVADLMDTYLMYSDIESLELALEVTYEILIPQGENKMEIPCYTPEAYLLLCGCYYFTNEEKCAELAKEIVWKLKDHINESNSESKWVLFLAMRLYQSTVDESNCFCTSKEWEKYLDEELIRMENGEKNDDIVFEVRYFDLLAVREFSLLEVN